MYLQEPSEDLTSAILQFFFYGAHLYWELWSGLWKANIVGSKSSLLRASPAVEVCGEAKTS